MGITGFIPGPVLIAYALTGKKYPQKMVEIQRTGLPGSFFPTIVVTVQNPEYGNRESILARSWCMAFLY
jgi:hypothetical protein